MAVVVEIRGSLFKSTVDLLRDLKWIFSFLCTIMSRVALKMVLYVEKKKTVIKQKARAITQVVSTLVWNS